MNLSITALKNFLDEKSDFYNHPGFIPEDPIAIPHQFTLKEDIEIAGFLTATIAWGNRKSIIKNANRLIQMMDFAPYEFISGAEESDFNKFSSFVHRTFNGIDCVFFLQSVSNIYKQYGGLEAIFSEPVQNGKSIKESIINFRRVFFELPHLHRTEKHIANPSTNASAKRLNMFLRWMVRTDNRGVDFGIWNSLKPADLYCPLDIHTGNVARKLGILTRKSNDWKSVEALTNVLRKMDPADPVKYDFALFGLGVYEKF
ncbi:MAG: TIGR02757 family protein [Bacteroidales bacterium]|nr:TIGR02757 family protein [Bacteroidales bacterium]